MTTPIQKTTPTQFDPFRFKPQYLDGSPATDVKPTLGREWVTNLRNEIQAHINAGYAGVKANSVSGSDIALVANSTTRVSASAPGFHCISRHCGENTQDPEASYMDWTNAVLPTKMDIYC